MRGFILPATVRGLAEPPLLQGYAGQLSACASFEGGAGVTGACLITRKDIFDLVGGFTEDYVIGDYEDSDLCLKIRQLGFQIFYEPAVALYHFERRSIRRSTDYMRGLASQYNSWLHTQRWDDDITELMVPPREQEGTADLSNVIMTKSERSAA